MSSSSSLHKKLIWLLFLRYVVGEVPKVIKWQNATISFSQTAIWLRDTQKKCELPEVEYQFEPQGFGSNLHRWALALCHASSNNSKLLTVPPWIWEDTSWCSAAELERPMSCYFQEGAAAAKSCITQERNVYRPAWAHNPRLGPRSTGLCRLPENVVYYAAIQLLFTSISPKLLRDADDAARNVFGSEIPSNLISVHIRWGDKGSEMELIPITDYIEAIEQLMDRNKESFPPNQEISIFLSTEDPSAEEKFRKAAVLRKWRVYYYAAAILHQKDAVGKPQMDAKRRNGASGRHSLIALILSMQAKLYVLTRGSNWSRLMDEIRVSILDNRAGCQRCTDVISLNRGGPKRRKEHQEKPIERRRLALMHSPAHIKECHCRFLHYTSAPLEAKWIDQIREWQNDADICKHISDEEKMQWINATLSLQAAGGLEGKHQIVISASSQAPMAAWGGALSVYTFQRRIKGGEIDFVHIPIEPTAAFMRDPRKCWEPFTERYTQSKAYLVPLSIQNIACAASIGDDRGWNNNHISGSGALRTVTGSGGACDATGVNSEFARQGAKAVLFDAGATLPSKNGGKNTWTGTAWLHDWYSSMGIRFDEIYAWEPIRPRNEGSLGEAFRNVPASMLAGLHFYPLGVTAEVGHRLNPLTLIRNRTRSGDFVVFKLDIDSEGTELQLLQSLLADDELLDLVDEFYFEMHCCTSVMAMHGMACTENSKKVLADWYEMVTPARQRGLRIHFWP